MDEEEIVRMFSCGSADWPRFVIFHTERDLYWSKQRQRWIQRPELWLHAYECQAELKTARHFADEIELEEEDEWHE